MFILILIIFGDDEDSEGAQEGVKADKEDKKAH